MKNVRFRYTKFSYEFYRNNDNALKEKITWDSCSDLRFKQRLLQTSVNVFLRFTAKLLYFRLDFMFRQIRTKKIFIKELFKPRNTTFIKYEGR